MTLTRIRTIPKPLDWTCINVGSGIGKAYARMSCYNFRVAERRLDNPHHRLKKALTCHAGLWGKLGRIACAVIVLLLRVLHSERFSLPKRRPTPAGASR
jgi:hypothetical protein